ncbi:MAG: hypothetical protein C7B45_06175 [Sulfobacillus acidophilus]|uniref:Uncharacterized protein n=1 Tax=Sulfobacillus acidophilus TaxID=53633 RepID=A0A2T2WK91_9FIRM|nr:MAG: hypothetical protein C7B45_06175 [Sulfobacillus acidophilus]
MTVQNAAGRDGGWERLRAQVQEANPDLQDALDVAAVLESLGWTDRQMERRFGFPDVFAAAEELYAGIRRQVTQTAIPVQVHVPRSALVWSVIRDLGHGLTFTLPMIVSVAAMITLHISFASYQYFSVPNATAIALATFFSFLTTGGFTQAMTNIYYVLTGMQKVSEIEATVFLVMRWSIVVTLAFAALVIVGDFVFPIMPESLVLLMILYMVMLSLLWLSFTGLYILRREYFLAFITAFAIAIAYLLHRQGLAVQWAQMVAIAAASLTGIVTSLVIFRRRTRGFESLQGVFQTRLAQLAHGATPYFIYGLLYFIFVYVDRLVAWSSQTTYLPYNIWFRGQYELGMDWSLVALFLPLSIAEVLISTVMRRIENLEHQLHVREAGDLLHSMQRTYFTLLTIFVGISVVGVLLTHIGVGLLAPLRLFRLSVPVHGVEPFVFTWSSWSYVLFSVAIFNILMLFTLSHPQPALRVLIYGIGIDLLSGVLATQILNGYQYAVIGLFIGALFIAAYSTRMVLSLLPQLDYYLYRLA